MVKAVDKKTEKFWHRVTLSVEQDSADMVRSAIQALHCCGIEDEDTSAGRERLNAYFEGDVDTSIIRRHMEIITELISSVRGRGRRLTLESIETIPEEDWARKWREAWKPIKVTKNLIICPSWEEFPERDGQIIVKIYPRMAFGTGDHPSTQLCLRLLERYMPSGPNVIDIGAGSGILAIAAVKLGARRATAVEIDDDAVENARENCAINRVRAKVRIIHAGFDSQIRGRFDFGVCNLLAHEMAPLLEDITRLLSGTSLILSGLSKESAPKIRQRLKSLGWRIRKTLTKDEWLAMFAVHEAQRLR